MLTLLKIVLIVIIIISFMGVIGETKDGQLRSSMTGICIASIFATVAAFIWI